MTVPVTDRTKLNALVPNLDIGDVADPALRLAVFQEIYSKLDQIIVDLNTAEAIGQIGSIPDGFVTTPKLADASVTLPKLAVDTVQKINQIVQLERQVANLTAVSTIANRTDGASAFIYDLNDGLNGGSIGKIDLTKTNVSGATSIGATTVTVVSVTGLAAGQEVTLFDDVNLERPIIASINTGTKQVTFTAALTKAYKDQAQLCRSSVLQDTTNKLLKFGGWGTITTYAVTSPTTVIASAFDTSGNGGRKLTRLSNGWIVAVVKNASNALNFYVSKDNGATWSQLCFINSSLATAGYSLCSFGTMVYVIWADSNATGNGFAKFDATTVANATLPGIVAIDASQTAFGNCSLAINSAGTGLRAPWVSKNTTYPNSFNIRYAEGTIAGDGTVTWGAVAQITTDNTTGTDNTNPSIAIRSDGNAVIDYQKVTSTTFAIATHFFNGTAWTIATTPPYPAAATYSQSFPSTLVKKNGSNVGRKFTLWDGLDGTDTAKRNIHAAYSDDGGVNHTIIGKITSGNTVDRQKAVLAEDASGNVYAVYMDNTGISYQQLPNGSTTWGTVQTLNATGTNPTVIERLDFSVPITSYMDASQVKFKGTWVASVSAPVLVEDARYNITPASNISNAVAWVDRETDAGLSLSAGLSIHATTESFASMTKTTATVDGTTSEDQFIGTGTANSKATLRVTLTRTSTSINKAIKSVMGAVGA